MSKYRTPAAVRGSFGGPFPEPGRGTSRTTRVPVNSAPFRRPGLAVLLFARRSAGSRPRLFPDAPRRLKADQDLETSRSPSRAGAIVCSICSSVCAAEVNAASNWLHGRYTPRSIIAQKKRAKRATSLRRAVS